MFFVRVFVESQLYIPYHQYFLPFSFQIPSFFCSPSFLLCFLLSSSLTLLTSFIRSFYPSFLPSFLPSFFSFFLLLTFLSFLPPFLNFFCLPSFHLSFITFFLHFFLPDQKLMPQIMSIVFRTGTRLQRST